MFLRNAWYVAEWERNIGASPFAITILGENVAIYRGASGQYAALADACPHRKVPLSMGRVQGDDGVTTWRWMLDTQPAPFYAPYLQFEGNCDRKQQYEVQYPSNALIK